MTLLEVFVPKGTITEGQRRQLAEQLIMQVMSADGAPEEVIERVRAITQVVVCEPDAWAVGGRLVEPGVDVRYIVRANVPGGHLTDDMRTEMITRITRVLAEVDPNPERLYQEPLAWVHIVEVPDGNMGAFGQIVRTADIVRLTVTGERPNPAPVASDATAPETVIDPICKMTVSLTETAITLEHDGTVYGFCSHACRDLFVEFNSVAADD